MSQTQLGLDRYLENRSCTEDKLISFYTAFEGSMETEDVKRICYLSCDYFKSLINLINRAINNDTTPYTFSLAAKVVDTEFKIRDQLARYPVSYLMGIYPLDTSICLGLKEAFNEFTNRFKDIIIAVSLQDHPFFNVLFKNKKVACNIVSTGLKPEVKENGT